MTLPDEQKQKLLRSFHEHTLTEGWNFKESGPNEADRQLLVEYENVVTELKMLAPECADLRSSYPMPYLTDPEQVPGRHH